MTAWTIPAITFVAAVGLAACQSNRPPAAATAPADTPLPTALPADAVQLTGDQIQTAFSGVREDFVSIDWPGTTASGVWNADGTMSARWNHGTDGGEVAGDWYVDGDTRCIRFEQTDGPNPECTTIYAHGDGYLSVNPDGSLHGYHTNSPL
ncbi:MAG: hypothetical protein ACFCVH_02245 [Alphaproteobacteria bacterium]